MKHETMKCVVACPPQFFLRLGKTPGVKYIHCKNKIAVLYIANCFVLQYFVTILPMLVQRINVLLHFTMHRQESVVALCFSMKVDEIVRGMKDGD